jgi:hypothetical protein
MRKRAAAAFAVLFLSALFFFGSGRAGAQTIQFTARDIALRSGESSELSDVFFIGLNCKSLLKATPQVEIMDGPPGVSAVINPAQVIPRGVGCAKPVPGGKLVITANDVQDHSYTRMVLRINYKTATGDRQLSKNVNLTLFPRD